MTETPLPMSNLLHAVEAVGIIRPEPVDMRAAALWYADKLGWPVFPLKARGKTPLTRNGFKDATLELAAIHAWWTDTPDANIGVPTGPAPTGCGFDVIDVDGDIGIASMQQLAGELPQVVAIAFTPGDGMQRRPGRHLFTPATGHGNTVGFEPGMDYRGAGGYIVAPPSIALHGVRYAWIERPEVPS